ncbi:MAG TPA: Na+/H+ antiporter subunit B [Thermoanaerobaculia bacterium]|nr:Na+/H+ antiporter subunit B [Thermoanaerobaculia bacterium]HPA51821.1 Na+/H+ antiporter subunit B [Thermoanaerobaculia bacterium]HQN07731.1 Na+/H+ antiporter subunit B [Thermoanaerobaculia bacterium]HQP86307.1 Na+/H+ antiporter subunit B [Thermoanaerobaculia bacterium]
MRSLILAAATRVVFPLLLLFSVFLLFRGHNEPGGGFVGGLVAATAYALLALTGGVAAARRVLPARPEVLIGTGLLAALASGLVGLAAGRPFMTGLWGDVSLPVVGKPGTPVLFDAGVYLTVLGVVLLILLTLQEEDEA